MASRSPAVLCSRRDQAVQTDESGGHGGGGDVSGGDESDVDEAVAGLLARLSRADLEALIGRAVRDGAPLRRADLENAAGRDGGLTAGTLMVDGVSYLLRRI